MALGLHILADFYNVEFLDGNKMMEMIEEAVKYAKMHETGRAYHEFDNGSSSGIIMVEESHLSFHTWVEYREVVLDIFSCGDEEQTEKAYEYVYDTLKPKRVDVRRVHRG